jgi:Ca2+-binding RTX toxin-like protein
LIGGGGNDTYVVNITALGVLEDTLTAGAGIDSVIVEDVYNSSVVKNLDCSGNHREL